MSDFELAGLAAGAYAVPASYAAGDVAAVRTGNVVAFRGTRPDALADWLRDLDAVPVYDQVLGYCHRGFIDGARATLPLILADRAVPLLLVGHSLGGALALLTAALLLAERRPVLGVATFGAPRAAGGRLRAALMETTVRQYRHGDDPVTEVPFLPLVFEHPTQLIAIGQPSVDPLTDHAISGYLAALAPAA